MLILVKHGRRVDDATGHRGHRSLRPAYVMPPRMIRRAVELRDGADRTRVNS